MREGLWTDTCTHVIGYVNIVVPGEGLEPEIRNVETWGVGSYIGDVNIGGGGGVQVRRQIWLYGDVHIMGRVGEFWDKHWIC